MIAFPTWMHIRPWRRHSLVLLISGLIFGGIGTSFTTWQEGGPRYQALVVPLYFAPLGFWAMVFMAAGFLAVISSRWPKISEKWGYVVLTGLSAGWSASYGIGTFFTISDSANWTGCLIWGLIAILWWAMSGLVNPEDVVVVGDCYESD